MSSVSMCFISTCVYPLTISCGGGNVSCLFLPLLHENWLFKVFYLNFQWSQLALCSDRSNHLATTKKNFLFLFFVFCCKDVWERKREFFKIININALDPFKIDHLKYYWSWKKQESKRTRRRNRDVSSNYGKLGSISNHEYSTLKKLTKAVKIQIPTGNAHGHRSENQQVINKYSSMRFVL